MTKNLDFFTYINELKDVAIKNSSSEVRPVYHYTNIGSFDKIVSNQSFRFTDYRYLNDTQEFIWGVNLIKYVLEQMNEKTAKTILRNLHLFNNVNLFTASFSLEPDKLSQWRAYGNNGRGIAFGVSPNKMANSFGASIFCGEIEYDSKKQRKRIKKFLRESIDFFKNRELSIESIIRYLSLIIATHKHQAFSEENEYRLFIISNTEQLPPFLETRINSDGNKPFCLLNTIETVKNMEVKELLPIDEIYIGPSCDKYATEIFIKNLLMSKKYDLDNIKIIKSSIPYRC